MCYFSATWKGLYGAGAALLISEISMNLYVLPNSLRIAQDTLPAFMASLLSYPSSLRPAQLLAGLRRSRPGLEAE
jgi:hypothetical protein